MKTPMRPKNCPECNVLEGYMHDPNCSQIYIDETGEQWPYIWYPTICNRCGSIGINNHKNNVLDDWDRYVQPNKREQPICKMCFDWIRSQQRKFSNKL